MKLLTNKYFNREAFKATMKKVWCPIKLLRFHEMGEGLMLAEFADQNNKNRVLNDGPWNFDKSLILVREFEGEKQVKNIQLNEAAF